VERRADEMARLIASYAACHQAGPRRMQPKVCEDEDLMLMCYQSRDFREGMDALLSKRPPPWTGE
jgi:enoyl-CoA hydratase